MTDYARRAKALREVLAQDEDQYEVVLNHYPPTEDDELDRHYVIVRGDGFTVDVQYHQTYTHGTTPGGSWKTLMQTPEREAERLALAERVERRRVAISGMVLA